MKIKCLFCNKESVRTFRLKVPVCASHYEDFIGEQKAWYSGKIGKEERTMMILAKQYGLIK
jgi:hypothetical protein